MAADKKDEPGSSGSQKNESSEKDNGSKPSKSKTVMPNQKEEMLSGPVTNKTEQGAAEQAAPEVENVKVRNPAWTSAKEPNKKKSSLPEKIGSLIQYLKEVRVEFRKISWPGAREVVQATYSVLVLVAIITLLVLGFDFALSKVFFGPLEHWAHLHGGGIGRG